MLAIPLKPEEVPQVWDRVKPLIDKALVHTIGEQTSHDILIKLVKKENILFIGVEAQEIMSALVGEVMIYPQKRVFHITTWANKTGHDYEQWMQLFDVVEDFARMQGCTLISAWTRKGLAKKLNWTHEYSVVTKNL